MEANIQMERGWAGLAAEGEREPRPLGTKHLPLALWGWVTEGRTLDGGIPHWSPQDTGTCSAFGAQV